MNKSTSLYLDLLRVISAFAVLIGHVNFPWFSNDLFPGVWGHKFVLIFFVLSGYLIAFTVDKKNKGAERYLADRLSRLYSVVLPALFFTYGIDYIGMYLNHDFYKDIVPPDHQVFRFLINFSFLQQIWGLSVKPSSNAAFWSIAYEFWYYILFWVFYYFRGYHRMIGLCIVSLIIGLKILLLLPVWVSGVLAYNFQKRVNLKSKNALTVFAASFVLIFIVIFWGDFTLFSGKYVFGQAPLFFSSDFISSWIFSILVAVNIFGISYIDFKIKMPSFLQNAIKYLSSITFSLYLYHLPILVFIASEIPYNKSSHFQIILLLILVIAVVSFLSQITEKQRGNVKFIVERAISLVKKNVEQGTTDAPV